MWGMVNKITFVRLVIMWTKIKFTLLRCNLICAVGGGHNWGVTKNRIIFCSGKGCLWNDEGFKSLEFWGDGKRDMRRVVHPSRILNPNPFDPKLMTSPLCYGGLGRDVSRFSCFKIEPSTFAFRAFKTK